MAHTDHPGIVLENDKRGQLLGLVGTKNIIEYLDENDIKVRVYNPAGEFIGNAKIDKIIPGPKQELWVKADFEVPRNSIGMLDIFPFDETDTTLNLYNADDGLMVSILLYLLTSKLIGNTYDVFLAFMKHEEVHQVSSWWLTRTNYINLTTDDYVLNLECLKTESIDSEKYGAVDYNGGPVLQLSNTGCLFGYKNPGPNKLELTLRQIAHTSSLKLQVGVIKDSCDSRPFTQFELTPNICTLTIPNIYKHNGADDGIIRSEEIKKADVVTCVELLTSLTSLESSQGIVLESVSEKLKNENAVTDEVLLKRKAKLNNRLDIAYKSVVKRNYFYPQSVTDKLMDFVLKTISYLRY